MEITREHFKMMIILLYKLEEYEACDALLQVLKRIDTPEKPNLRLIKS